MILSIQFLVVCPWQSNSNYLALSFLIWKMCVRVIVWDNGINTCLAWCLAPKDFPLQSVVIMSLSRVGWKSLCQPPLLPWSIPGPEVEGDSSRLRARGRCPEIYARSWIWGVGTLSDKFPFRLVHRTWDLLSTSTHRWSHSAPNMHMCIRRVIVQYVLRNTLLSVHVTLSRQWPHFLLLTVR